MINPTILLIIATTVWVVLYNKIKLKLPINEWMANCLPWVKNLEEWIKIYENIPGYKEKVENFWIVAIKF